ncbi:MAG: DUF4365 domain-containing protein [Candidatus Thiodiazotropha sp.]
MKKKQSKTIHIGNMGEHYIAAKLARYCIVRDVGQGKDTGIDLYCEIVHPDSLRLSLHFFCQVKTQKNDITLSSIEEKYWTYWGDQPVPVFLFLVKYTEENKIQDNSEVWVYDIPYILATRDADKDGKPKPIRDVSEKFLISRESNNRDKMSLDDFIHHHISWSYGLWYMRRFGLVLPNPEVLRQERKILVSGFSFQYESKIRNTIDLAKYLIDQEIVQRAHAKPKDTC